MIWAYVYIRGYSAVTNRYSADTVYQTCDAVSARVDAAHRKTARDRRFFSVWLFYYGLGGQFGNNL